MSQKIPVTPRRKKLKKNLEEKLLKPELRTPMKMRKINLLRKTKNSPSQINPGLSGCMKIGDLSVEQKALLFEAGHGTHLPSTTFVNFRKCRWGSSLTVCARLTVRSSPHQHERKFYGAHVCRVTFKHLPQSLRSYIPSFRTLGKLLKIHPFVRPNIA